MKRIWTAADLARALISAAAAAAAAAATANHQPGPSSLGKWAPALEQLLHRLLGCRDSLTPTLVAGVIDPFLLHHHSLALGFFDWAAQQPGFTHTSATYQSILKSLSVSRQFNHLEKLLKQCQALNIHIHPSVRDAVLSSLIVGRKTHLALLMFHRVRDGISDVAPGTCNSLLAALSSEGNIRDAQTVFDEMLHRGIPLTTLGFGVFIWRFSRDAQVGQILKLLDDVKTADFSRINGSILAVLVVQGFCSQTKRAVEAIQLLDELRKRECKPDFIAYRVVAESLREIGCAIEVANVLKKKRKLGVAPRADDYKNFIFALIGERLINEGKELGQVIVSGNFPLEDDVVNALIASVSTIDPSTSISFLKYMLQRGKLPALGTLTNLSENLCKHGRLNELVENFEILSGKEYFTDIPSYNVKVGFLCKAGKLREAYESIQEMKKQGLSPDVACYNTLLDACCQDDLIRPAKRLWDEMFTNGCQGNSQSYSILIHKFVEIKEIEEAYKMFCHMIDKGLLPDETIYKSLLAGLCEARNLEAALEVFHKSAEQDTELGRSTLSTFIVHLCREGLFLPASNLLTSRTAELGNLDAHVTFMKFIADAEEARLAIDHLRWIGDKSPAMLAALRTSILSFSSPPKLKAVLKSFEQGMAAA